MTSRPPSHASVDSLEEPSDDLEAQIEKMLQATYKTTAIQKTISEMDYVMRKIEYGMTKRDKDRKEQLKDLTKLVHHLRTSAVIACEDEHDGTADYWSNLFLEVGEYFQGPDEVDKWVRQLYKPSEMAQINGITMSSNSSLSSGADLSPPTNPPSENGIWTLELESGTVNGEPLRMAERIYSVDVERINGQALELEPPCHTDPLQDELVIANYNEQDCGTSATSGGGKPSNPLLNDRTMENDSTDDTAQGKPADVQGAVDHLVKGVALPGLSVESEPNVEGTVGRHAFENKLVQIGYGVSGAIQGCATDGDSCEIKLLAGNTTGGDHNQDDVVQIESSQEKPGEDELTEEVCMTDNSRGNDTVEDRHARSAHNMSKTYNIIHRTSSGSSRIVRAATDAFEISGAEALVNEGRHMENDITGVEPSDAKSSGCDPVDLEPAETSAGYDATGSRCPLASASLEEPIDSNAGPRKLSLVGSAKTMTVNDIAIQSGSVGQSNVKYSFQYRTSEDSTHASIVNGNCAQSQPTAAALRQNKLIDEPVERHSDRDAAELGAFEETGDREILLRKSSSSSAPNKGSCQLDLAGHRMVGTEPISMRSVVSDQPEKIHIATQILLSVVEPDPTTDHPTTIRPAMSSGDISPMPTRKESMSDGELEAGHSAGLDLRLSSRVRPVEVFCWPSYEQRGPYVVVMVQRQLGLGAAVIGVLALSLYLAYRWWG